MLDRDEVYGQCPRCTRVFVISIFNRYPQCNYDSVILNKVGKEYPVGAKVGP